MFRKFRFLPLFFAVLLLIPTLSGCFSADCETYTFRIGLREAPLCWNPFMQRTEAESFLAEFCEIGLVSAGGIREEGAGWEWEMASAVSDITAEFPDRDTWDITEPSGRVFRITLNPAACWEDGTPIKASTYVNSMKMLLDPKKQYSGAVRFCSGSAALKNAEAYRQSGTAYYVPVVAPYTDVRTADYSFDIETRDIWLSLYSRDMTLTRQYSIADAADAGYIDTFLYTQICSYADPFGYVQVTEENKEDLRSLVNGFLSYLGLLYSDEAYKEMLFYRTGELHREIPFTEVGLYAASDYELILITEHPADQDSLFRLLSENWIVPEGTFSENYGTSVSDYTSYGPYKLTSIAEDGTIHLEKNERWYGYTDGRHTNQYLSTSAEIRILPDSSTAIQLFLQGKLDCLRIPETENVPAAEGMNLIFCTQSAACSPTDSILLSARIRFPVSTPCTVHNPALFRSVSFTHDDASWDRYIASRGGLLIDP